MRQPATLLSHEGKMPFFLHLFRNTKCIKLQTENANFIQILHSVNFHTLCATPLTANGFCFTCFHRGTSSYFHIGRWRAENIIRSVKYCIRSVNEWFLWGIRFAWRWVKNCCFSHFISAKQRILRIYIISHFHITLNPKNGSSDELVVKGFWIL